MLPTLLALLAPPALAYSFTVDADGRVLAWPQTDDTAYLPLVGIPGNQGGVDADAFAMASVRALQRWEVASGGRVTFDYWQVTDPAVVRPGIREDGHSTLFFTSQDEESLAYVGVALGYTHLWYDPATAEILEVDVALNDAFYTFTDDPDFANSDREEGPLVFLIDDVITHELGHAFGVFHTGGYGASQFTFTWPDQDTLRCDDIAGIRALYAPGEDLFLEGRVLDPAGAPFFGAEVVAISRSRRTAFATALTARDGTFRIGGLEPGTYFLMVQPFTGDGEDLSAWYADVYPLICPDATRFSRSFATDGDGVTLRAFDPTDAADVGDLTVGCTADGGADVPGLPQPGRRDEARVLLTGPDGRIDLVDNFANGTSGAWLALPGISGDLVISALTTSLYSSVSLRFILEDATGEEVPTFEARPSFEDPRSGYRNYDTTLIAEDLPEGDYYLRVVALGLPDDLLPEAGRYNDARPFGVIVASMNEDLDLDALKSGRPAECLQDEAGFPTYAPLDGEPPRRDLGCACNSTGGAPALSTLALLALLLRRRRR